MGKSSTASISILEIGGKAYDALRRSGGRADPISSFGDVGYRLAGDEIIWVGSRRHLMHPRAVLIDKSKLPFDRLDVAGCSPWQPAPLPFGVPTSMLRANACRLQAMIRRAGEPKGFGKLLAGDLPEFPLSYGAPRVHAFASAIADRDPHLAATAALPLLGLGPGLTPSGDDLVGAAFFGKRLAPCEDSARSAWDGAARALAAEARRRSNVISAALFTDLTEGRSFAQLHRLAWALAESVSDDDVVAAARDLVAIGHSSGWDMLAGLIIGITGTVDGSPQCERSLSYGAPHP